MARPLLSAALIVRDEERYLPDCLRSIEAVVDEAVVVDTGSTDTSRDIARGLGARLFETPWRGDFAQARNVALDHCRGAWILYIDADERLRPCSREELERMLRKWYRAGYWVRLQPRRGYTAYREMRLFRNHPKIRFEGAMHETIWPALGRYMRRGGGLVGDSGLVLDHEGYEADQERKHQRDLPLLLEALEADPGRVYCWWHLGHVHRGLGQLAEARDAWRRGMAVVRAKRVRQGEDSLPFVELIRLGLDEGENVGDLLREARKMFPAHPYLVWLEARHLLQQGRHTDAIRRFEWLLERGRNAADGRMACDERLFASWPWAGIATCLFQQRRYAESRRFFARAETFEPDCLEYRIKRQLCERLSGAAAAATHSTRRASTG